MIFHMRCISPILIRSAPKLAKPLGGNGLKRDFVPCGKCNFCLQTKRMDWSFRLNQELKKSKTAYFLTLTYNDYEVPFHPYHEVQTLDKSHVQLFKKSLRKGNAAMVDWPVRYYTVGEYGTITDRPHYHSIIFNLHEKIVDRLSDFWKRGNVFVGDVNPSSIGYVTKYVVNRHSDNFARDPPFSLMSRRPGLGASYLESHRSWHIDGMRNFTQVNGQVSRLPRYYKEKFFDPGQRKILSDEAVALGDYNEMLNIEKLSKFHDDPYFYSDERVARQHDSITSKINLSNKF